MSVAFDRHLRHTLTIVRLAPDNSDLDDYGQPTTTSTDLATVRCRIDPKTNPMGRTGGVEESLSQDVGAQLNDFTIYMRQTDITPADILRDANGVQYRVMQVRDGGGAGHHYEVDVRRLTPDLEIPADGS